MLIEYKRTGAVVETRWGIPFSMLFPFDYKTPVNHAIVMVTLVLITIPFISPFLAIDIMFLGSANYVVAYFKDLRVEISSLQDLKLKKKGQPRDREFLTRMGFVIDHHNRLFSLVQKMEDVFGDILVTQYAGAMFCFCSLGYLSILVSLPFDLLPHSARALFFQNAGSSFILGNILCMLTIAFELFIFSFMGSLISRESERVGDVIWDLNWYEQAPGRRFYYRKILQRCQKSCRILALKWIPSSLVSFRAVLSTSYSLFNVLRVMSGKKD